MKQIILFLQLLVLSMAALAQKKVLDHTVYDGWQSIGERKISADGEWVAYTIDVQEGDGVLVVQRSDSSYKQTFSRGYNLAFTNDNLFLVFKVKPTYLETRNAKIKKKKPEDQPKDSLVILDLTAKTTQTFADIASYKMPKNASGYLGFLKVKKSMDSVSKAAPKDSIKQKIDTLKQQVPILIEHQPEKKQKRKLTAKGEQDEESSDDTEMNEDAEGEDNASQSVQEGSDLLLYKFSNKTQIIFPFTSEYYWSENGKILLMESSASKSNKSRKPLVSIWRTVENRLDTLLLGGNDFK
jgi:hypothetical protein